MKDPRPSRAAAGGPALLVALLASLALLSTGEHAHARVGDDPCRGTEDFGPGLYLDCGSKNEIGIWRTETLPTFGTWPACDRGWRLAGTGGSNWTRWTARWDFWSHNGEWVTWTGGGEFKYQDGHAVLFRPDVFNWWAGSDWQVRLFNLCERAATSRGVADPEVSATAVEVSGSAGESLDGTTDDDVQAGRGGDDELGGGAGNDEQYAGAGDDAVTGGEGDDQILGGDGDDVADGGAGSDELFDNAGSDVLNGGDGEDRFSARDGGRDRIVCGRGEDVVVANDRDRVSEDCEHVYESRAEAPKRPPV
jgi:hypothetical protein